MVSWILSNLFLKINVIFTHSPYFRCQEIFKSNVTHCLWQCSYFILEFLRPQVKPSSPGNLLAFTAAQMLDSGSKSETCFASILCSVTKWGSKKVLSTPSASSQGELRMKGGLVRTGGKTPPQAPGTCPVWEGGTHHTCKRCSDHCTQDPAVELCGTYPVLTHNRPCAPHHRAAAVTQQVRFQVSELSSHLAK